MANCEACGREVDSAELVIVEVCKQTHSSPAEHEQWCMGCVGPDVDEHDGAWIRYLLNHPDAEDCS